MSLLKHFTACITILGCCTACTRMDELTSSGSQADGGRATKIYTGYAVYGHEVRAFRVCGEKQERWAIDRSGELWELHQRKVFGLRPYAGLFAIVQARPVPVPDTGFGAGYVSGLEIDGVLYVAAEGFDCNLDLDRFVYRASGNEPYWTAVLLPGRIMLGRLGEPDQYFLNPDSMPLENGIHYNAVSEDGGLLELDIEHVRCRDTMSNAHYGMTARLSVDSTVLYGCALKGKVNTKKTGSGR